MWKSATTKGSVDPQAKPTSIASFRLGSVRYFQSKPPPSLAESPARVDVGVPLMQIADENVSDHLWVRAGARGESKLTA
jgi:hypothetical protein